MTSEEQAREQSIDITFSITVSFDESVIQEPYFRWQFFDGSKMTTKAVNVKNGWTLVESNNNDDDEDQKKETMHYEHVFTQVKSNASVAHRISNDPMLYVFLGDLTNETTTGHHIGCLEVDISPLLSGSLLINNTWSNNQSLLLQGVSQSPPGLLDVQVQIQVQQPFLTSALTNELNPLKLTLRNVTDVPGIEVTSKSLLQYVQPTTYTLLQEHCQPTFALLRFFNDLPPRFVRTRGISHRSKCVWEHDTVLLMSSFQKEDLLENVLSNSISIELHDRDLDKDKMLASYFTEEIQGLDLFDMDDYLISQFKERDLHAGDTNTHGIATFRLNELLSTSQQKSRSFTQQSNSTIQPITLSLSSNVIPQKKRIYPKGEDASNASTVQRLLGQPGTYLSTSCSCKIKVHLHRPLILLNNAAVEKPNAGPFARMVLVMQYSNTTFLKRVLDLIDAVNEKVFPTVSLRSYQLSADERTAADAGTLDIITGFTVIDLHHRVLVVEGIASSGMSRLEKELERNGPNTFDYILLMNTKDIHFEHRLYGIFDVDLKKIKLRDPLPMLLKMPEIYMRSKVSAACFHAINCIRDLRKSNTLRDCATFNLFPSPTSLLEIESKYGESITMEDIDGTIPVLKSKRKTTVESTPLQQVTTDNARPIVVEERNRRLKAATDSFNPAFEEAKRKRREKNYLEEVKELQAAVLKEYATTKEAYALEHPETDEPVYNYSGQKLQTTERVKAAMRDRLASDTKSSYTYSTEFQSLAMCMVDEDRIMADAALASRRKWTTQRGFVYPAPRSAQEFIRHPHAPSAQRVEELKEPWIENQGQPSATSENETLLDKPKFDSIPSHGIVFGGTNGDGSVNEMYFKSVHLCGDGMEKEMEEIKIAEAAAWMNKVVVDKSQMQFRAHHVRGPDKVSAINRRKDWIHGPVLSKPLRIVRNSTLPSGKRVPLQPAPTSILSNDEFREASEFDQNLRAPFNVNQSPAGKDFLLQLPTASRSVLSKRLIQPLRKDEKVGSRWRSE